MPKLLVAPTAYPVSIGEAKSHLRITSFVEDDVVQSLIAAATGYLDGYAGILGRAIMTQTWRDEFSEWGTLRLSLPDVSSATVTYKNSAGAYVELAGQTLLRDDLGFYIDATGDDTDSIRVDYVCSMATDKLQIVRLVVLLLVAHWFSNREATTAQSMSNLPFGVSALVEPLCWRVI